MDDPLDRAYVRHRVALVRLAVLLTGNQALAEDLVHDAFIASRGRLAAIPEGNAHAYLRSAVVNRWRNVQRHRRVELRSASALVERPLADHADTFAAHDEMWRAICSLPPRQRGVIVLRYYEDLPDAQIAQLLGCTAITVRSQSKRALDKLRGVIADVR